MVLGTTQVLGGDPALAQRMWYSALFVGAALGAIGLLGALRMTPLAALIGATVYVLSPFVVSYVTINPVYLAALGLLAAIPAAIIGAGTGQISVRLGAVLVAISAPLIGYVDLNPPLVGMLLGAMITAPLVTAWVDGRVAASRSFRTLLLATPLLLAASSYWAVPSILHLSTVVTDQLAPTASWDWTEARATVRNAFWLNSFWAWSFPEYFTYANRYESFPLSSLRFVLPSIAFSTLALASFTLTAGQSVQRHRNLRLAVVAATVALAVIFLSTGTKPPGNSVFNWLYNLPMGWLLREPGRFLMVAALAYAVLVGVAIETLVKGQSIADSFRIQGDWLKKSRWMGVVATLAIAVSVGFPMYTGAVVPDIRPKLPSAHVHVPSYWTEMARFVDGLPTKGSVLVMPPDDFYSMPYSWGYYGTDDFVVNLFHRPVLVPNGQGYSPATSQVISAVSLAAKSFLEHDWKLAEALVAALDTPLVLVRGDIPSPYPGRSILPPSDIAAALGAAPNFHLVRRIGDLELFELRSPIVEIGRVHYLVTTNSQTPDLRLLRLLPSGAALISSPAETGIANALQAPPLDKWQARGDSLIWKPDAPKGWTYRIADLQTGATEALSQKGTFKIGESNVSVQYAPGSADPITVSMNRGSKSSLVLVAEPDIPTSSVGLVIWHGTYSTQWHGSNDGRHVLVDGMLNGWLIPSGSPPFTLSYRPATIVSAGRWMSTGALLVTLVLITWKWIRKLMGWVPLKLLTTLKLATSLGERRGGTR